MLCFNQWTVSTTVNYKWLTFVLLVKVLRSKWEDNIKMDLKGTGYEGLGWINLIQDRDKWRDIVNSLINLGVSNGAGNFFD